MINIAILGFGIIGSGVADVIDENNSVISKKIGDCINIKYILDLKKIEGKYADRQTDSIDIIINDPEVSLVVETMGGSNPAYDFSVRAMQSKKSVVTSNKEVVAKFGSELLRTAVENDVSYFFEASVGGGIPIIRPIYNCLAANKINAITAILNGTTNFILTQMITNNKSFDEALLQAQKNGYAEANPSADVDGIDTCRKICILSSLAFGKQLPPEKVHTEGIRNIKLEDILIVEKHGYKIKLIAKSVQKQDDTVSVVVAPHLVHNDCPLYNIEDVYNGILVTGNAIGDVMFYGKGAGKLPTASAVVADIMDALNKNTKNIAWEKSSGNFVTDYKTEETKLYIRVKSIVHNVEFEIKGLFPHAEVFTNTTNNDFYFFTSPVNSVNELCLSLNDINEKIEIMKNNGFEIVSALRIM